MRVGFYMNQNVQKRNRAKKLLESGNIDEALFLLAQNIKDSAKDIDSIYLAGICYVRSGNFASAEKHFNKAVKLNKHLFQAYADLGLSQSAQGKLSDAIRSFKQALIINPAFAPAHSNIALVYLRTHEARKALHHANQSVAIDGINPAYQNVVALCYRESNQTEKAVATFKNINATHPEYYGAFQGLYETYRLINDIPNAESVLLRAKALFSAHVPVYKTLGKLYEQSDRADQARDLYSEAIDSCGDRPDLLISLGRVNRILGNFNEGLAQIDKALSIDNASQPALAERCSMHILSGEYDEAHTLLGNFISANKQQPLTPGLALAYAQVCRLTKRYEDSVKVLRNTLETPGIPDDMTSVILFSMGDGYDKMNKYDRAFTLYGKANNVARCKSDIALYLEGLRDIESGIRSGYPDKAIRSDSATRKPVFIVGMPRSGTSLTEQIIASHPDAYGAGELTQLWSIGQEISRSKNFEHYTENLASLGKESANLYAERYLAYLENLAPHALRVTDKLPHNFMNIGLIKQLFPEAFIIHCHRHPFDTCLSVYFKKFNDRHLYARNLSEIARFYAAYRDLMNTWGNTATNIFSLKYETLVANQEKLSRDIISHIGLDWDDKCLRHYESDRLVTTLSYTQANQPIYTGAVNRWKNYRPHLQPLIDVLGDPEQYE